MQSNPSWDKINSKRTYSLKQYLLRGAKISGTADCHKLYNFPSHQYTFNAQQIWNIDSIISASDIAAFGGFYARNIWRQILD